MSDQPKMESYIVAPPVRMEMDAQQKPAPIAVIISLNEDPNHPELGVQPAREAIRKLLLDLGHDPKDIRDSDFYLFANLLPSEIEQLEKVPQWVYQIWKDEQIRAHLLDTAETLKASACWRMFGALGNGITWAVLDTGIRYKHPHFAEDQFAMNFCRNFSGDPDDDDHEGHGTHVAGIIAGAIPAAASEKRPRAARFFENQALAKVADLPANPSGIAPKTRLVNVKVLDKNATGSASSAILGLQHVRKINEASRTINIDGVNMSLGYPFDPKWYGCGHSPLCEEVERAVASGLIVVISCGNAGYGKASLDDGTESPIFFGQSISDPANAENAIAVGSTHKSRPHTYGISYFSSKGPTGDGRMKPDLVAPGEKVLSCSLKYDCTDGPAYEYEERSGTSMAAPHVSGAIAAFLSVHQEYRGNPRVVKEIFVKNAMDLGRKAEFQGAGMVDLLRAVMAV
jgi:serine protease AprX